MCARLAADGIDISYEKLLEAFPDCVITRGHYSRYLLDHGYVKSLPEAFDRYLGDHTKYFVPREKITPAQAVSLILAVKGIPVLAHPTLYHMGKDNLSSLVRHLKEAGLVALEAVYSTYSAGEERQTTRTRAESSGNLQKNTPSPRPAAPIFTEKANPDWSLEPAMASFLSRKIF